MNAHLRYLKYVLLHKLLVFRAGWMLREQVQRPLVAWLWRLLVHDWSKFTPAEWTPYVQTFYGTSIESITQRQAIQWRAVSERSHGPMTPAGEQGHAVAVEQFRAALKRDRQAAFNRAWLHHIHANDHHWQHHILRQDNGPELTLIPESWVIDEMIADWLGAGPKALRNPSMAEAVAETVVWYAQNHAKMQMRDTVRQRVEMTLLELSRRYGIEQAAQSIASAQRARASIVIPGR